MEQKKSKKIKEERRIKNYFNDLQMAKLPYSFPFLNLNYATKDR
tara:strand:+ start:306 stop:437 length:132 start_codon:yes stop_codon:yes gene_type:complete